MFKKLLMAVILVFSMTCSAFAGDVTLSWDANLEPDIASYNVHYGDVNRTQIISLNVGNVTPFTFTGLSAGTYYFAVSAVDSSLNESEKSYEVVVEVPLSIPTGLKVL